MEAKRNTLTVTLDLDVVRRIDKMAEKMGLSRSKIASSLLSSATVEVELFDKTGLLRLGSWIEWLISRVRSHDSELEDKQPDISKTTVTITLPEAELEYISKVAEKFFFTKAKFASNMIVANLPNLEILEKIGIVDAVLFFHDIKERAIKISNDKRKGKSIPI
jgi:hypothetical protein